MGIGFGSLETFLTLLPESTIVLEGQCSAERVASSDLKESDVTMGPRSLSCTIVVEKGIIHKMSCHIIICIRLSFRREAVLFSFVVDHSSV